MVETPGLESPDESAHDANDPANFLSSVAHRFVCGAARSMPRQFGAGLRLALAGRATPPIDAARNPSIMPINKSSAGGKT
jgi:hypothetical protein